MRDLKTALVSLLMVACFVLTACVSDNPSHSEKAERAAYDALKDYSKQSVKTSDLRVSYVSISSSASYTYAEGSITNYGKSTVKFVEVKGLFQTNTGTTIDTDWTYAVGSEGLAPGESKKFSLSVKKDLSIKKCSVSVVDFDS